MKKMLNITGLFLLICLSSAFGMGEAEQDKYMSSSGTGFFINADGDIITNAHVIEGADNEIYVIINGDEYYPARVIRQNDSTDLAVLRIDYSNPYHFKITDFNTTNLGDRLSVLGYPLSGILTQDIRFTDGSLSSRSGLESRPHYFQHSVPIQPGNSGGPIINNRFEVIGVATASLERIGGSIPQNINFGVKSEFISPLLRGSLFTQPNIINADGTRRRSDGDPIMPGNGNIRSIADAEKATVQVINFYEEVNTSITITNNTGYTIREVFVSPTSSNSWGANRLETFPGISKPLDNNNSVNISSLRSNNRYDIRLVDRDGDTYTKNVLIKPNQSIVFVIGDIDR
jgi:S1-C subfamily serine protease